MANNMWQVQIHGMSTSQLVPMPSVHHTSSCSNHTKTTKVRSINTERKGHTNKPVNRGRKYKQKMWQNLYTHTHTEKINRGGWWWWWGGGGRKGYPNSSITEYKLNTAPRYCIRQDSYSNWPSQCTQTLQPHTTKKACITICKFQITNLFSNEATQNNEEN